MQLIKNIVIPGGGALPLTVDIALPEAVQPLPVVLYAHGFNGFKDWGNGDLMAAAFADAGFVHIKFNFSHNGTSPEEPESFTNLDAFGKNNYSLQLADMQSLLQWLISSANPYRLLMNLNDINLTGHSMGGGIAILFAAANHRISRLATWAAISACKTPWSSWPNERLDVWEKTGVDYYKNTRTNQQMPLYYQLYEDYQLNRYKLDIKTALQHLKIPLLICHGEYDLSVPVENAYLLKEWQPNAELFIVESNHVFDRRHPWILNYLPKAMQMVVNKTISFFKQPAQVK
jgi:dienelactone hydrolase